MHFDETVQNLRKILFDWTYLKNSAPLLIKIEASYSFVFSFSFRVDGLFIKKKLKGYEILKKCSKICSNSHYKKQFLHFLNFECNRVGQNEKFQNASVQGHGANCYLCSFCVQLQINWSSFVVQYVAVTFSTFWEHEYYTCAGEVAHSARIKSLYCKKIKDLKFSVIFAEIQVLWESSYSLGMKDVS